MIFLYQKENPSRHITKTKHYSYVALCNQYSLVVKNTTST